MKLIPVYLQALLVACEALTFGVLVGTEIGDPAPQAYRAEIEHNIQVTATVEAAAKVYSTVDSPRDRSREGLIPMSELDRSYR